MAFTHGIFIDVATESRLELDEATMRRVEERIDEAVNVNRRLIGGVTLAVLLMIGAGLAIGVGIMTLMKSAGMPKPLAITTVAVVNPTLLLLTWFRVFPPIMRRHRAERAARVRL